MIAALTGHRPPKIGGYLYANPVRCALRDALAAELGRLGVLHVISGMALGFDQDGARVALAAKIPFTAALPFRGQHSKWPESSQNAYKALMRKAARIVVVSEGAYTAAAMQKRNEWMVNQVAGESGVLIAAWDGTDGGTANCIAYAKRKGARVINIGEKVFAA